MLGRVKSREGERGAEERAWETECMIRKSAFYHKYSIVARSTAAGTQLSAAIFSPRGSWASIPFQYLENELSKHQCLSIEARKLDLLLIWP